MGAWPLRLPMIVASRLFRYSTSLRNRNPFAGQFKPCLSQPLIAKRMLPPTSYLYIVFLTLCNSNEGDPNLLYARTQPRASATAMKLNQIMRMHTHNRGRL